MPKDFRGIRLPQWMDTAVKELSERTGENQSQVVIYLLEKRLNELGYRSELDKIISSSDAEKLPGAEGIEATG